MGTWGTSLYADDFAKDLKSAVGAVSRLPFAPEDLLAQLCAVEPGAAKDPSDADHTIFWLVVADQFWARGIVSPLAQEMALDIIDKNIDLAAMGARGMDAKSLATRRATLEALRGRLAAPPTEAKARTVLKKPQSLILQAGEIFAYPVSKTEPINPYAVGKEWAWVKAWQQDGWGAFVVAERGLAFDYLAWYRPLVIGEVITAEPAMADLMAPHLWLLRNPGTLTARHRQNLQLKPLGCVAIDSAKFAGAWPKRASPIASVVSDISLANSVSVRGLGPHEEHRIKHG